MKFYCHIDPNKVIINPDVCKLRAQNKNLPECPDSCSGPSPKFKKDISRKIINILDKEKSHKPGEVFRVKEHKKYLIKKYGYGFYKRVGIF